MVTLSLAGGNVTEKYKPKKLFYADENSFYDEFCGTCGGTEAVGESGGEKCYGCDPQDAAYEIAEKNGCFDPDKAEKTIEKLRECAEFYAKPENWGNSGNQNINRMPCVDTEQISFDYHGKWLNKALVGGKRARQCVKELASSKE